MSIRLQNNFKKRFGNNPIKITYLDKPLSPSERRFQNDKIFETVKAVLTGTLKREPTEKEPFGLEDISKNLPLEKGAS